MLARPAAEPGTLQQPTGHHAPSGDRGHLKQLSKKAGRGYRGHPLATIAFYGPTDRAATKVAVGIVRVESGDVDELERWSVEQGDIRHNAEVEMEIIQFLMGRSVRSVAVSPGILGCPHEEGIDYPDGETCPSCPFWAGRDRWSGGRDPG